MDKEQLLKLLEGVRSGNISVDDAVLELKCEPFQDIGIAKIDHHRGLRKGIPEVIYGAGKTPEQIVKIVEAQISGGESRVIITRMSTEAAEMVGKHFQLHYEPLSRFGLVGEFPDKDLKGRIVVATGGTSDIPAAEEAALTALALGNNVERLYDVGVAGLHRLLSNMDSIMNAKVIVAVAGMEGALASVIGGLADCPVIAVPTSVGYGAAFGGVSALLSMLNSCASGVSVVNIDNGFGAGYLASIINHIGE